MHACWILLCMSLKSFILCILKFLKVSVSERSPRVGLKVACPGLWVAGYVTVWYQSFWLKHRVVWARSIGQSLGLRSNPDHGVENLRRNGIAESTWEIEHQRPM
jgi:predicted metal-binding membrane protein